MVKHHCAKQWGHLQKHPEKKIQLFIAYPSYSHVLRKVIYDPAHVLQSNKYCDRLRTCIFKKTVSGKFFFNVLILFVCRESRKLLVNTESVKCEIDVTGKVY